MILTGRSGDPLLLARQIQRASHGRVAVTAQGIRLGDLNAERFRGLGMDAARVEGVLSQVIEVSLRPGDYPIETLLDLTSRGLVIRDALNELYRTHLPFIVQDIVPGIEARQLKVLLEGGAGSGVVSAVQDIVTAFCSAGYYGRAFPLFDPSKKGAPVEGYGIVSREPILSHAPFETPDMVLLFDPKLFPRLRNQLGRYANADPRGMVILVNTPMTPEEFRAAAGFDDPFLLHTLSAAAILKGKRIPPNYAMIGGMLGILGREAVDPAAFAEVVRVSLTEKFGGGENVEANLRALEEAQGRIMGESPHPYARGLSALGKVSAPAVPEGQVILCEDGNRAIARAIAMVLNLFPSVVAAYPITPQTQIVEWLAKMIADGILSAEGVTPESEHGAGAAVMGAARDRVLAFTATSSQGLALMSENLHSLAGMRMGNVVLSNVVRSLNSPLDVENDHGDLYKVLLDAGFIIMMSRDVQQAADFHLMSYLIGMYAEYRKKNGQLEMIPDKSVMLPTVVASEGFEVSHAPERYVALTDAVVKRFYDDSFFSYVKTFVDTPNLSITGALQLSNSRQDTDYQRHLAMQVAYRVLKEIFARFERYTGRKYDFISSYNVQESDVVFVVAGAANGTFEEVAREFKRHGINVGVAHPNVIRPFPAEEWAQLLKGKKVIVYDRDDAYGAVGGRLYTELAGVVNEHKLAETGTDLFSRIYGLGGRTPSLPFVRDEMHQALASLDGTRELSRSKQYSGVKI